MGEQMMLGTKIQIGVIVIALALAGFFLFRGAQNPIDMSVNSWTISRTFGRDQSKPISAVNPLDPKKTELVDGFGCYDGRLEIIQYPNDTDRHPRIVPFPEKRGGPRPYVYFQDPLAPVAQVKDPFRHALALATYHTVYEKPLGLLGRVDLTPDQISKEAQARQRMMDIKSVVDAQVDLGTFHPELMDAVLKALVTYKAKSGDPTKDAPKAALARKVLEAAAKYMKRIQEEKDKEIDAYMDVMAGALDAAQQQKLVDAVEQWDAQQTGRKPVVKNVRAPAPGARGRGRGAAPPATAVGG